MFGRRRKHGKPDHVEPDLPITPMLDMSFQLMAFFLITFNPTPPEGHLDMALPAEKGGPSAVAPSPLPDEEAEELVVTVEADEKGGIADLKLGSKDATDAESLGPDSRALFDRLKARKPKAGAKTAKVKLVMAEGLQYKMVIKLMDEITRAGYPQVAPALLDTAKK